MRAAAGHMVSVPAGSDLVATGVDFDEFVRTQVPALLRTAYLLTGGDGPAAEDAVQETLTRLYPRWTKVQRADHPVAYVRRSLINTYLNGVRSVVFLVIGATIGAVALVRHVTAAPPAAPSSVTSPPTPTGPPPSVGPTTPQPSSPEHSVVTPSGPSSVPGSAGGPVGGPVPAGFTVHDLTFVSDDEGWALGTAPCASGPCTSLVRTTDGGRSWVGVRPPVIGLTGVDDCTAGCVSNVRFASSLIGYLFGPQVLYLTRDGGATWQRQPGGAAALEIGAGDVLRVPSEDGQACFPGCPVSVQVSTIGGTSWCTVLALPATQVGADTGIQLARTGQQAYLQIYGHVSGGASQAHSALYAGSDGGRVWSYRGEPCPQGSGGEVDATALSTAADGSVSVLCTQRSAAAASFVAVSRDEGRTFRSGKVLDQLQMQVGSASASTVFVVGAIGGRESLVRSADGGRTWTVVAQSGRLAAETLPRGGFLGFESARTGRWVSVSDSRTVWTTRDAGVTWTSFTFR